MFQILVAEEDKNTRRLMEAVLKEHMIRADRAFAGADGKDGEDAQGEKKG